MKSTVVMLVLLLFGSQRCGLAVHGSTQELRINTMPQGAIATIGMQSCVTPCRLKVPRTVQNLYVETGAYKKDL